MNDMTGFGSTTEDQDGVPKGIDRGPPEEDWKTPAELRGAMQDVAQAKLTMGELATVKGIQAEMKMMKQQMDDLMENNNRLVGLISTLQGQFQQYEKQRAIELTSWIAGRGTTPEDDD
jgi:hypothetical protein